MPQADIRTGPRLPNLGAGLIESLRELIGVPDLPKGRMHQPENLGRSPSRSLTRQELPFPMTVALDDQSPFQPRCAKSRVRDRPLQISVNTAKPQTQREPGVLDVDERLSSNHTN